MPPLDGGAYLIGYFWEVGPLAGGGMGASAISHTEILSWSSLVGIVLQPWEARLLRRLSREYAGELHKAEKANCPPPWDHPDVKPERGAMARALRDSMRRRAAGNLPTA
ncbi:MAG: hypothetical protein V4669_13625 [Pseudomonadota bacterium]